MLRAVGRENEELSGWGWWVGQLRGWGWWLGEMRILNVGGGG